MPRVLALGLLLSIPALSAGPCETSDHRAFDFWLGGWEVAGKNGKLAGTNQIEREHNGCVLHENYSTPNGYSGQSFSMFDRGRKTWHQTWVDSSGTLLQLDGGIEDGSMVLEGTTINRRGIEITNRITWTPNPNGTVRQHWQTTVDGKEWRTSFDGIYTRKK